MVICFKWYFALYYHIIRGSYYQLFCKAVCHKKLWSWT